MQRPRNTAALICADRVDAPYRRGALGSRLVIPPGGTPRACFG